MSDEKFTQGEWFVQANEHYLEVRNSQGMITDTCSSGHVFDGGDCLNGKAAVANAHLISAAPDMYRALRGLLDVIDWPADFPERIKAAEAALAKADGEQQ